MNHIYYKEKLIDRLIGGSWSFRFLGRRVTFYGRNAMHFAVNIRTKRHGWLCFQPPVRCFGVWWPWYIYFSPNATPWASTWAIGPGVDRDEKIRAAIRRYRFGLKYDMEDKSNRRELEHIKELCFYSPSCYAEPDQVQ